MPPRKNPSTHRTSAAIRRIHRKWAAKPSPPKRRENQEQHDQRDHLASFRNACRASQRRSFRIPGSEHVQAHTPARREPGSRRRLGLVFLELARTLGVCLAAPGRPGIVGLCPAHPRWRGEPRACRRGWRARSSSCSASSKPSDSPSPASSSGRSASSTLSVGSGSELTLPPMAAASAAAASISRCSLLRSAMSRGYPTDARANAPAVGMQRGTPPVRSVGSPQRAEPLPRRGP